MFYVSDDVGAVSATPRDVPAEADHRAAWVVGAGLAAQASAAFMIRDGHLPGSRITILERLASPADPPADEAGDDAGDDAEHVECLIDLSRSIPSLEIDGASVFDELAIRQTGLPAPLPASRYGSLAKPLYAWLVDEGVDFRFSTEVTGIGSDGVVLATADDRAGAGFAAPDARNFAVIGPAPDPSHAGASAAERSVRSGLEAAHRLLDLDEELLSAAG